MDLYFKIKFYEELIGLGILILFIIAYIILFIWSEKK